MVNIIIGIGIMTALVLAYSIGYANGQIAEMKKNEEIKRFVEVLLGTNDKHSTDHKEPWGGRPL